MLRSQAIRPKKLGSGLYCIKRMREIALFLLHACVKSDVTILFLDPNFLYDAGILAIREHFSRGVGSILKLGEQRSSAVRARIEAPKAPRG